MIVNGQTVEVLDGVFSCSCPAACKHLIQAGKELAEKQLAEAKGRKLRPDLSGPPVILAHSWDGEQDLSGWLYSEKLDGVRAYWDARREAILIGNWAHRCRSRVTACDGLPGDLLIHRADQGRDP